MPDSGDNILFPGQLEPIVGPQNAFCLVASLIAEETDYRGTDERQSLS